MIRIQLCRSAFGSRVLVAALLLIVLLPGAPAVFAQAANPDGFDARTGRLEAAGSYLVRPYGSAVAYLDNGIVFSYGLGPAVSEWKSQAAQERSLRTRSGANSTLPGSGPKWYDPAMRGWQRLPAPPQCVHSARYLHTTTVTADGKVLVAGGLCDGPKMADDHTPHPAYAALSLWDGGTRRWLPAPSLAQPRIFHSATPTPDGAVLLIGGESDPALSEASSSPVLASVERFQGGRLQTLPALAHARAKHAATALPGGRVLVTGGFDASGRAIASAELFDAGGWRSLPPLQVARHRHTATLLADGRVLVAGGIGADGSMRDSTEIWDPAHQAWRAGPVLPIALYGQAALQLASGQVLIAGGGWLPVSGRAVPWAWTWNPQEEDWELAALATPANESEMSSPVNLVAQQDGSVLVFTSAAIERWLPASSPSHEGADQIAGVPAAGKPLLPLRPARAPAAPQAQQDSQAGALTDFLEYRWLLLAIGVPVLGFVLLRRARFLRQIPRLSRGPSWILRIVVYGALVAVAAPLLGKLFALRAGATAQAGSGPVPCWMVGVWSSRHGGTLRQVELRDDGSFAQAANLAAGDAAGGYSGRWERTRESMVWYTEDRHGAADVNPMTVTGPASFVLTEENGSTTDFERVRSVASTRCSAG